MNKKSPKVKATKKYLGTEKGKEAVKKYRAKTSTLTISKEAKEAIDKAVIEGEKLSDTIIRLASK